MTYKQLNKFMLVQEEDNPTIQTVDASYIEVTGSKCEVVALSSSPNLLYKFSFYSRCGSTKQTLLNIKLQKSNDNFSSNIVDVPNCNFNISGDNRTSNETYDQTITPFFIIENFDSQYLRLVARSYSSTYQSILHRSNEYDGAAATTIYYNTSLIVSEL